MTLIYVKYDLWNWHWLCIYISKDLKQFLWKLCCPAGNLTMEFMLLFLFNRNNPALRSSPESSKKLINLLVIELTFGQSEIANLIAPMQYFVAQDKSLRSVFLGHPFLVSVESHAAFIMAVAKIEHRSYNIIALYLQSRHCSIVQIQGMISSLFLYYITCDILL